MIPPGKLSAAHKDTPPELFAKLRRGRMTVSGAKRYNVDPAWLAESLEWVSEFLLRPDAEEIIESNPEVAEILERIYVDGERLADIITFAATPHRTGPKYGLSPDSFWDIVLGQGFGCGICGVEFYAGGPKMLIDHNHDTGAVRGVLLVKMVVK